MDIHDQITSLIAQVNELSHSKARNKVISRLEDAQLWSEKLEPLQKTESQQAECICPIGGIRRDCPAVQHH